MQRSPSRGGAGKLCNYCFLLAHSGYLSPAPGRSRSKVEAPAFLGSSERGSAGDGDLQSLYVLACSIRGCQEDPKLPWVGLSGRTIYPSKDFGSYIMQPLFSKTGCMCLWAGLIDSVLLVRFRKLESDEMLTVFSLSEETILLLSKIE